MEASKEDPSDRTAPRKRGRARRWLGRIAYALFLLVFVEVALQGFYYATAGDWLFARMALPLFRVDEHAGHWNRSNIDLVHATNEFRVHLVTNGQGFRVPSAGVEYTVEKDPAKFRVMLLGPSFAYGWGADYEDSFAARVEKLLADEPIAGGRTVEVINAGVPSLANRNQLTWYEHVGRNYGPDLVIQLAYGSMDVPPRDERTVTADGYLMGRSDWKTRLRSRIKNSAIVFYGWIVYNAVADRVGDGPEEGVIEGAGRTMAVKTAFDPQDPSTIFSMEYYDELRRSVEGGGARLLIVHFPLSYCIHREDISRWRHLGVRDVDEQIDYEAAYCAYLGSRGFDCLNLTDDLAESARAGERLYYRLDIHWTKRGNEVAARAVADHFRLAPDSRDVR